MNAIASPRIEHGPDEKLSAEEQAQVDALNAFGLEIARKRKEAINARSQIGIEDEWIEDEEAYIGVDDANRAEYRSTWRKVKPVASGSAIQSSAKQPQPKVRSTALINITRPYVDAAAARIGDMLLPNDDKAWGIEPTPLPDLDPETMQALMVPVIDEETGEQMMFTQEDLLREIEKVAAERAKKAGTRIEDWMAEGRWAAEARDVIWYASKLGTGILKGPTPKTKRRLEWVFGQAGPPKKRITHTRVPVSCSIDPWNFFPDGACGEDIHDGSHVFERDDISVGRMLELMREQGYIRSQIKACLDEGPIRPEVDWTPQQELDRARVTEKTQYEIWYMQGLVELHDLACCGLNTAGLKFDDFGYESEYAHAIITMINHRIVKAAFMPLDDGSFTYDVFRWQRRPGLWTGLGVGRQIRTPQRILTAAVRNMMDNAALSAGPQIVIDTDALEPVDGVYEVVPRKVWRKKPGGEMTDAEKAFHVHSIETRQVELMNIIEFALRMAEESTGLPMILQGQLGEQKPNTLGQTQILNNNGSSVLRRLAKAFDDDITVPHVERYYQWLMEYGPDPLEKGDYEIVARGSSTLVERDLQNQEMVGIVQLSLDPAYGIDPQKAAEEFLRSRRYDPELFKKSREQLAEEADAQPTDPKIAAAAIQAQDKAAQREHEARENARDRAADRQKQVLDINSDHALFNAESAVAAEKGSGL